MSGVFHLLHLYVFINWAGATLSVLPSCFVRVCVRACVYRPCSGLVYGDVEK